MKEVSQRYCEIMIGRERETEKEQLFKVAWNFVL
jgi:hypothetical protein